jgi:predicted TIM-barrel fold metal-dependent hydrolase
MIFDCHVHLPSPGLKNTLEWEPCTQDTEVAVVYLRRCGVDCIVGSSTRALLAQTPEEVRIGNDEVARVAREYPGFIVPACQLNTNFPGEAIEELRRCKGELGMVWVGELCGYIGGYSYDTRAFREAIHVATEMNMIIQIHNDSAQGMAHLLTDFPDTIFVLAHLGDSPEEVEERISLAARFQNLYLDISGHGYQRMGVLELAVHQAGSRRIFFGSDFTINDPAGVIARIQAADLDAEIKDDLLGGNLKRLLMKHEWKV